MRQGRFPSIGNTALSDHSDSFAKAPSSAERGPLRDIPSGRTATLPFRSITQEAQSKLVVLSGEREGLERALSGVVTVGADASCDVVLPERGVSRRHAEFEVKPGGRVWVRDLGSRNGTFVQGTRVMEAELPLGAVVQLGETELGLFPRWRVREVEPSSQQRFGDLHGKSLALREVFAVLERVAATDIGLLIEGESGTGKELAARSVHQASTRADKPYVVFDCTTVPKDLAESELFGHRRGSFSGAVADREGAFQRADGGTIFLDEIGELPSDIQPKLLRVLETGEVRPVGDSAYRKVNVRVLCATHRDLHAEVRRGRFRSDLLYRLAVVRVCLPALRARPDDIALIIERLVGKELAPGDSIAGKNLEQLMSYSWPGNVRELRNVLARAVALSGKKPGDVRFSQLVFNLATSGEAPATLGYTFPGVDSALSYKDAKQQLLEQFEAEYIQALMKRHAGNITQVANAAGLSRKHVYELLRRIGVAGGEE
jgi:DNA-binding NtrC family response regulator